MKILLRLGCAATFVLSCSVAGALPPPGAQVSATVSQQCQINAGTSSAIDLTGAGVDVPVSGTFVYQCNFVGTPLLTFISANGGVQNGTNKANYGIYLNDQLPAFYGVPNPSQWLRASNSTGAGVPFVNITFTTAANTPKSPHFFVGLIEPVTVAGTYSDILTITIAP